VIDHLPFVGTVDEGSVTYRQRLFEVSMLVFWQSPLFGSFDYINNPLMEEMRQGQGIIDIVNSYLAVSLAHGVVGLVLFVGPFLTVLVACWRTHRRTGHLDPGSEAVGRAVLACMIGILVTIATVSSISVVPTIYWMVLGLGVAYARGFSAPRVVSDAATAVRGRPKRVSGHAPT
jgi:O-antigen ligase